MPRQTPGLALGLLLAAFVTVGLGSCGGAPRGEPVKAVGGVVEIDAGSIPADEVRFFRYESGGGATTFLIARTGDGELKAALDACVTCYPHKKGYRYEDDSVVCVYCGTRFRLGELGTGIGNCIPIRLEFTLDDGKVIIKESDLQDGARYF